MSKNFLIVLSTFIFAVLTMPILVYAQDRFGHGDNPQVQQLRQKMEQDMQPVKADREKLNQDMRQVEHDRNEMYKLKRQYTNERYQQHREPQNRPNATQTQSIQ